MVRIYRYILVAVLIALIAWGVWYVVSHCHKQSTYEEGVLVRIEAEDVYGVKCSESSECPECGRKEITYGAGYYLY